ncbi:hypothetical protein H107_01490, partial [Trichophyton rubrum CBS 202.88]
QQQQQQQSQTHARTRSGTVRGHSLHPSAQAPSAPVRTPTDISLGPLPHITSPAASSTAGAAAASPSTVTSDAPAGSETSEATTVVLVGNNDSNGNSNSHSHSASNSRPPLDDVPPPEYRSPGHSPPCGQAGGPPGEVPPIPTYDAAVRQSRERDGPRDQDDS